MHASIELKELTFVIKNLQIKDLKVVVEMEQRCYTDPWPKITFINIMLADSICRGAYSDQTLAGYLIAIKYPKWLHLVNLAVDVPYRKHGLGRTMLKDLLQTCEKTGKEHVTLEVRRSNLAAINLYSSEGFRQVGTQPKYYIDDEDAFIFTKVI